MSLRRLALAGLLATLSVPAAHAATVCTAIADAATGKVVRQEGTCDQPVTPASTFKIAISLMGYDSGFLKDLDTPALPFKKGYPDFLPSWRTTTDPTSWMKNSVVWYSQQITTAMGKDRFGGYVDRFRYGNMDVSGDPEKQDGLTRSWLSSSLRISPLEQLAFLEKVVRRELPVSPAAYDMTDAITRFEPLANGWEIHGKTGSGSPVRADGTTDGERPYGWFVGWATKGDRTFVFARLIQDETKQAVSGGYRARDAMLSELPALLDELS